MLRSSLLLGAAGALALTLATPTSAPAHDGGATVSDPIVSGLLSPLQFDLGHHGKIFVAQSFSGVLTQVNRDGTTEDLTRSPRGSTESPRDATAWPTPPPTSIPPPAPPC